MVALVQRLSYFGLFSQSAHKTRNSGRSIDNVDTPVYCAIVRHIANRACYSSSYNNIPPSSTACSALWAYGKLLRYTKRHERLNHTVADVFEENVNAHPEKTAVISETQKWTFRQVNEHANRVANVLQAQGYRKGDVVGLLMENRAEYVATWLGLSKIGIITPLINTNLRGPSLLHSITVAHCHALIYGEDFVEAMSDITKDLPNDLTLFQFNNENNNTQSEAVKQAKNLNTLLSAASTQKPGKAQVDHHDKLVYIYTSGTTGLPKAAVISHSR